MAGDMFIGGKIQQEKEDHKNNGAARPRPTKNTEQTTLVDPKRTRPERAGSERFRTEARTRVIMNKGEPLC
jgi:hypothetical protein